MTRNGVCRGLSRRPGHLAEISCSERSTRDEYRPDCPLRARRLRSGAESMLVGFVAWSSCCKQRSLCGQPCRIALHLDERLFASCSRSHGSGLALRCHHLHPCSHRLLHQRYLRERQDQAQLVKLHACEAKAVLPYQPFLCVALPGLQSQRSCYWSSWHPSLYALLFRLHSLSFRQGLSSSSF